MSEVVRRVKLLALVIEMVMMVGVPTPRRLDTLRQRFDTWRWERRRTRSLPQETRSYEDGVRRLVRGYESLQRTNPVLFESWNRSTHIRRKIAIR